MAHDITAQPPRLQDAINGANMYQDIYFYDTTTEQNQIIIATGI